MAVRLRKILLAVHTGVLVFLLAACAGGQTAPGPGSQTAHLAATGYEETGEASWYGHPYHGRRTASGEIFDMYQMTAAHPSLPFGTWIVVENRANGRSVKVRINDRGPNRSGRILDLSYAAARVLGAIGPGVIRVRLRVITSPEATRGLSEPLSHSRGRGGETMRS
ncbi:MAG TPA: septal ring lytic transglycosylase RlpA family protein [Candidatus Methylomirabilis sp.]|nr:septal ring lytic transglycosylase RlpA family protein [Candidatus Methylomirabilis sp.]